MKNIGILFVDYFFKNSGSLLGIGLGGRPELAHLRESGAIEQDADIVILLYRPAMLHIPTDRESGYPTEGLGVAIVAKQRNGETGNVYFGHNQSITKFYDYVPPMEYLNKYAK